MSPTIIVAVDQFHDEHVERIARAAEGWAEVRHLPETMSAREWESALADAIAVVGWPPAPLLGDAAVRLVVCGSAGFNAYLGEGVEENPSLVFCNSRGTMAIPVAEHAVAQMMILATKIRVHLDQRPADFRRLDPDAYEEVAGSTAVIVGLGDIGRALAERCLGLGMSVIGVRREGGDGDGHPVLGLDQLDEAVRKADHLFLTLPGGPATEGMIDERTISQLKPTAYLYNLSRGSVIDETALLAAVREGRIAGVALDVFATEPLPVDSPWWNEERALLTPHVAGLSKRFPDRYADLAVANIRAARTGGDYVNEVDLRTGAFV